MAPSDKRLTPVHLKVPPAPHQPKRALVLVDLPAVRVKKKGTPKLKDHTIIDQVLGNNAATAAKSQGGPAVVLQGEGKGGAAVVDTIVGIHLIVIHTPVALSVRQQEAVLTATVVAATQTAIVTTAQRVADGGTPNVHQILNMNEGEAMDTGDPGDINTLLPPQKSPAHDRVVTAEGRGTGGTIGVAQEAQVAGVTALVQDHGGAATAEVTVLPVAHPAPPKAHLTGEARGVGGMMRHTAETSTALASIAPSHHTHLHHEALTATPIHPAHRP